MVHRCFAQLRRALPISLLVAFSKQAAASPELSSDDPAYAKLYELHDRGLIPVSVLSTFRSVSEAQTETILQDNGLRRDRFLLDPGTRGFWFKPVDRLSNRWSVSSDEPRAYSVLPRYQTMAGAIELSCENTQGRPCGDGAFGTLELDSSAGHGTWFSAFSRLRVGATTASTHTIGPEVDRLYANIEFGPAQLMLGRNVFAVGPGRHTQLLWGYNAPPLDRATLSVRALHVPGIPVAVGGGYVLGRLDNPQHFRNTLVSIARVHLEIADRLCLGMTNLLQLGGEGAPPVGFGQFIEEHVHRTGVWPSEGVSNRRLGYDASLQLKPLNSFVYFEFVFEDWRAQFKSALKYDTDYLLGWATSGLGRGGSYGFVIELLRTGVRSQEHGLFQSGMTSGGRAVGSPLGPDATSLYASPRLKVHDVLTLSPWTEVIHIGSDTYVFPDNAAISRVASGLAEIRWRAGLGALASFSDGLWLDAGGFFEHVHDEAFQIARRNNVGLSLSINWSADTK